MPTLYDRKKQQTNPVIATKSLACKLAKAAWHVNEGRMCPTMRRASSAGKAEGFRGDRSEPAKGSGHPKPTGLNGHGCLPSPKPPRGSGPRKKFMVIRPSREVATGWTRCPKARASHKSLPLNEPGLALNVFWLPDGRERRALRADGSPPAADRTVTQAGATRWNQMGD